MPQVTPEERSFLFDQTGNAAGKIRRHKPLWHPSKESREEEQPQRTLNQEGGREQRHRQRHWQQGHQHQQQYEQQLLSERPPTQSEGLREIEKQEQRKWREDMKKQLQQIKEKQQYEVLCLQDQLQQSEEELQQAKRQLREIEEIQQQRLLRFEIQLQSSDPQQQRRQQRYPSGGNIGRGALTQRINDDVYEDEEDHLYDNAPVFPALRERTSHF